MTSRSLASDALVERYFGAFLDEIVKHGGDVNETAGESTRERLGPRPEVDDPGVQGVHNVNGPIKTFRLRER